MGKIEIIRDFKKMQSGLKDIVTGKVIIPCHYNMNLFTMVSDADELVNGIYVLKNKNLRKEVVFGIYFQNGDYLLPLFDCELTLYRYTDFNALFTHLFENKSHSSAIIFDNNGKFLTHARINKISEYNQDKIKELGILTDRERVYLIDGEFYTLDCNKYPFVNSEDSTYPFTRLKDRIFAKVESEFGEKAIDADSVMELDYKYDMVKDKMRGAYIKSDYLQTKYPKLKRKIK